MNRFHKAWLALPLLIVGCANPDGVQANQVLVCTINGRETYRSPPSRYWIRQDSGAWTSAGYGDQYAQSYLESCHTERVGVAR